MTFHNPLQYGSDPFVMLADDGYYYILCSGWKFYRSRDMVTLEPLPDAYVPKESDWFYGDAAAPELYRFGGRYWIFHTTESKDNPTGELENRKIGVLVSDRPEGPYTDYLGRPLFEARCCAIDINVYQEDGRYYLYYCHSCYHHPVGKNDIEESWIYGVELKSDFTGVIGEPVLLARPCQEWENHSVPLHKRRWNEGPFVFRHGDTYYMTFSANTFEDYGVGYATAPAPLGPFTKAEENPILKPEPEKGIYAPGHNSFFRSRDGKQLYMAYHMITSFPFNDPSIPLIGNVSGDCIAVDTSALDAERETGKGLPADGYMLQHWPGYAHEYMDLIPVTDNYRKIAIDRVHFTDDGKLVLEGPTLTQQQL